MTIKEFKVQLALGTLPFEVIGDLAKSKRTLKKILTILSTDSDWTARYWVACNPSTPIKVLKILSEDEDCVVRSSVARNPNTPVEILEKLSKDENWYVRCRLFESNLDMRSKNDYEAQLPRHRKGLTNYIYKGDK